MDFKNKTDIQKVKLITSHFAYAKQRRRSYEALWDILSRIFLPRRYDLLRNNRRGSQYGSKVYAFQPAIAANKNALGMLNYMASKSQPWFAFGSSNQRIMKDDSVKKYYQDAAEQVLWSFNKSTFFGSSVWFVKDGVVIGTAASVPEYNFRDDKVIYKTIHPGESYIEDDQYGQPCVYFRCLKRTAIQLYQMVDKEKLPADIVAAAEGRDISKNPFTEYDILMAVYRNTDYTGKEESLDPKDGENKLFYILLNCKEPDKQLIMETGIEHFPLIWRMGKEPDNSYGTSLAADALTAALIDNKLGEKGLMAVHLAVEPPVVAHENQRGKVRLNPGGRNYVKDNNEKINTILGNLNWPVSDVQMDRLNKAIDDTFFIRFFEMLSNIETQITAYQARQMMGEKAVLMSSITETFEEQYLNGAVDTQWVYEEMAGRMPDAPDILLDPDYGEGHVDINYIGPLAQLQRSVLKSKGIIDSLEIIGMVQKIWPESVIKINEMELIEDACIAQGMPQDLFKTDQQIAEILEAQRQKEEMAEAVTMGTQIAKALPSTNEAIVPDSPLALMAGE